MKKWLWIAALAVLVALLLPIPQPPYDDGGTREYVALTYKIVDWNRITDDGVYEKLRIYPLFARNAAIDALWEEESASIPHHFVGRIVELDKFSALVEPMEWEWESRSSDRISVGLANLEDIDAVVNDLVEISYMGGVMESYPAQIHALSWKKAQELRQMNYPGIWLNPERSEEYGTASFEHIIITEIYADCFFASTVIPLPYLIKLNGQLGDDWCVGDQVSVTYENGRYDTETNHFEGDLKTIEVSTFRPDPNVCYKPVIYLYPEAETEVSVKLRVDGGLTCTYPAYGDGWRVTAAPDGTLTDGKGQTYNYLYWEGQMNVDFDLSAGFCVKGTDTAAFLEDALQKLGLNRREANEFIVYWLPLMEGNPYNIISFQTDAYTDAAALDISPAPDTVIRVFMAWKRSENFVEMASQTLTAPPRTGFTVIEWGGTQIPA
jgi:hypothetical protein